MDARIRIVMFAVIGGVAGYFVGDLIANKFVETEYEVIEQEDVIEEEEEVVEEKPKELERPRMRVKNRSSILTRDYNGISKKKEDLTKLARRYNGEEVKEAEELLDTVTTSDEEEIDTPPQEEKDPLNFQVISEQEYNERDEVRGYTKTVLHYYAKDDVVTDEGDGLVPNPEQFIGDEALVSFGKMSMADDPDIVYVYNPRTMELYQIIRFDKSYRATVLGEVEKRVPRRKTPRKANGKDEEP